MDYYCGEGCLSEKFPFGFPDFQIQAGSSKKKNIGYVFSDSLIMERLANSWNNEHSYGIPVDRQELNKDDSILHILKSIRHPNILELRDFCKCYVEVEYIDGWIFNSHKQRRLLFDRSFEEDYIDNSTVMELIKSIDKVKQAMHILHEHQLLHTDLTDFNVLVRKSTKEPVIIDLLGSIKIGTQKFDIERDYWVFVNHFLIPTLTRKKLQTEEQIKLYFTEYSQTNLDDYISNLYTLVSDNSRDFV